MRAPFGLALLLATVLATLLALGEPAAASASASTWAEAGDAGSLLADAQQPSGRGTLTEITGAISTRGSSSDEDLYEVCLTGEDFSATTTTGSDPMLYLFDAAGRFVDYNDDAFVYESQLVLSAPAPGTYHLAIVGLGNYAKRANNGSMWRLGQGPLDHWREAGIFTFGYRIALSGVEFCSGPSDSTGPTVTISRPADGATHRLGESVSADYACADEDGGSGLASCAGPVASGAAVDTASVGAKKFTVTAHDNAGHETTVTHRYRVTYPFTGFLAPVDDDAVNVLAAGQAVPLKFGLGGDRGLGVLAGPPTSRPVPCDGSLSPDPVEPTVTAGASRLSYDPVTGIYSYTWKTDRAWATTCRQLTVNLNDGSSHRALFTLTR